MKWRDLEDVVARLYDKEDIKGFRKQDIILGPGEAMIIIEEGKISEIVTQTRLRNMAGGFKNWLARRAGVGKDIIYLFVDTRPFEVDSQFQGSTKDYITVNGNLTVKMQINVNEATKLLNFMRQYLVAQYKTKGIFRKKEVFDKFETEGSSLSKTSINEIILEEMSAKVITPVIGRHNAEELHGDTQVVQDLRTEATVGLRKTMNMWGIELTDLYASFGETDFDRMQKYKAERVLEADKDDADFIRVTRDNERRGDLYRTQLTKAEEAKDITFQKEQERRNQLEMDRLQKERLEDEQDMETLQKMIGLKEKMKTQKIHEFQETDLKGKELDNQKEIELARIDAEKAKHSMETYKEAQERESKKHLETMEQYSKVLGVTPAGNVGGKPGGPDNSRICIHCGMSVDPAWKACPHCAKKL